MTLNGEMALSLRYVTEFGGFRAHCVKMVDKATGATTAENLVLI